MNRSVKSIFRSLTAVSLSVCMTVNLTMIPVYADESVSNPSVVTQRPYGSMYRKEITPDGRHVDETGARTN